MLLNIHDSPDSVIQRQNIKPNSFKWLQTQDLFRIFPTYFRQIYNFFKRTNYRNATISIVRVYYILGEKVN